MQCPGCQVPDIEMGSVVLKKSVWDWGFFGLGFCNLYFRKQDEKWKQVLEFGTVRDAWQCASCGTLVIQPRDRWPADGT